MSIERMEDFARFLTDLGGLHDAKVTKFVLDVPQHSFRIEVDDIYSNYEGLPDCKGPKPAEIVLQDIRSVKIAFDSGSDEFNIYAFLIHRTDDGRWRASIEFWPEGKIGMDFLDVEFPREF